MLQCSSCSFGVLFAFYFVALNIVIILPAYLYSKSEKNRENTLQFFRNNGIALNSKFDFRIKRKKIAFLIDYVCFFVCAFLLASLHNRHLPDEKAIKYIIVLIILFFSLLMIVWDYFVGDLIVNNDIVFVKCVTSKFRWILLINDKNMDFYSLGFISFGNRYILGISYNKRRFLFTNVANKDEFISLLKVRTNSEITLEDNHGWRRNK